MKIVKETKMVYVGLSGGVDSAVSAALLQKQGFKVVGVFIRVWQPNWIKCTWKEDRLDAMRVCAKLNIPFRTLDLEDRYKKYVVDYMIAEYRAGRTPNPDVMCNKFVKFGGFFDWAVSQGADYVATGHYARIMSGQQNREKNSHFTLLTGLDKNKDQSYFLWTLTPKQLEKTIFPVGHLEKTKVRKLAKQYDLPIAEKKDSQGLCFIGKVNMVDFLQKFIKTKKGKILNEAGEIVGEHKGAVLYTIGQRHGLQIAKHTTADPRYFVIKKDITKNTITISARINDVEKFDENKFTLKSVNWISSVVPDLNSSYRARIRYRGTLYPCQITNVNIKKQECTLVFTETPTASALGQSIVIYKNNICLGGGIIKTKNFYSV